MPDQPIKSDLPAHRDSLGLGKFNLATLNQQMEAKIDSLPKDAKGAIVGLLDDSGEAHVAIVMQKEIGPGTLAWSLEASKKFKGTPADKLEWQTQVQYTWPR